MVKHLTPQDAVAVEMTTNTYAVYDALKPHVHSVTVVHPPHVALIVRAQVKTDKKAALTLAQLHAAGLLPGIWIPPLEVRELRALVAQRLKLVCMATMSKNRLHAVLHRNHIQPPEGNDLFAAHQRQWWSQLPITPLEQFRLQSDLDMLDFARQQIERLENCLAQLAAKDKRLPLLVQLPGIGLLNAITIVAAIGDITRFPGAKELVGYAGLGARVHDSGLTYTTGRITKSGRRDLRRAMVEAAHHAVEHHPHWKAEFKRLELHLGRSKAKVAIARKLLVVVWHVLAEEVADRFAEPVQVARSFVAYAYWIGVKNLPDSQSAKQFTRGQLDRLGIGKDLQEIRWGSKQIQLPPSKLAE